MSAIRHRHVIRLLEVFETNHHLFMVLEYADGGDLLHHVKKVKALTEDEARPLFRQIVYGIAHCHCRSVIHRDIKLDNILIDESGFVKICDFGISKLLEDPKAVLFEQCGTPAYIAPEILADIGYSGFASDVWGLGVLLYAMVCGTVPFRAANMRDLKAVIQSGQIKFPPHHPRDSRKPFSPGLMSLIRSMCTVDPAKRITIPEILSHNWINNLDVDSPPLHQILKNGLTMMQLQQSSSLQPFNNRPHSMQASPLEQIKIENLFPLHKSDSQKPEPKSFQAKSPIRNIKLASVDFDEIAIDHATLHINENIIGQLEAFGFPAR